MSRLDRELHEAHARRLLELSRDALRRAGATAPDDIGAQLGLLSQVLRAVDANLAAAQHRLARDTALCSVDGPFAGAPEDARRVAASWLARARAEGRCAREDLDSAHIAASGLVRDDPQLSGGNRPAS